MKPGKPICFGIKNGKAWFGLPGNPISAMVTFCLFVLPYLGEPLVFRPLRLDHSVAGTGNRETFAPALLREGKLTLLPTVGSHALTSLVHATGVARIPANSSALNTGQELAYAEFPWSQKLPQENFHP